MIIQLNIQNKSNIKILKKMIIKNYMKILSNNKILKLIIQINKLRFIVTRNNKFRY